MSTPLDVCIGLVQTEPLVDFIVIGQPYSKANRRGNFGNRSIKSKEALGFEKAFAAQVPRIFPLIDGVLFAAIHIAYSSQRSDLDESLILDGMQGALITNDRQIRHRFVTHSIDKENPRSRIRLWRFDTSKLLVVS